jgi:hypothetical protein
MKLRELLVPKLSTQLSKLKERGGGGYKLLVVAQEGLDAGRGIDFEQISIALSLKQRF